MINTATKLKTIEREIAALQDDIRKLESARKRLDETFQQQMTEKHGLRQHDRLRPTKAFRKLAIDQRVPKSALRRDWRFWKYEINDTCHLIDAKWEHQANVPLGVVLDMRKAAKR